MVTQVGYSVAGRLRGLVAPCAVCTWHVENRSAGFLVEPYNHGRTVFAGLASKPVATVSSGLSLKPAATVFWWFDLKTCCDGFLQFVLKTGGDGFSWFGLKTGGWFLG
jgi:hypothetical protein